MWEIVQNLIERWGFPTGFGVWLMMMFSRELRDMRQMLHKLVTVNAVILNILDASGNGLLPESTKTQDEEDGARK
jgi:hypothetical protein